MIRQVQPLRPLQPLNPYGYVKRPTVSYTNPQDSYIADRNNPYSVDSVADVLFNVEGIKRVANSVEGYDSRDWGILAPISDRVVAAVSSLNQYYIKPLVSQDLNSFQKSMIIVSNSLNNMSETIDTVTGSNLIKGAIIESGQQDLTNQIGSLVAGTVTLSLLALSASMTGGLTLGLGFKALLGGQVAYGTSSLLTAVSMDPEGAARGVLKASGLSPMGRTQYDMEYKNWFNRIYAEMALDPINWLSFSGTLVNSFSKDLGFNISNSTLALGAKFAELDKSLMRFAYNSDPLIGALRGSVKLVKHAKNLRTKQLIRLAEQYVADPKSLSEVQVTKVYNYLKKPFDIVNDVRKRYRRTEYLEHIRGHDRDINQGVLQLYGDLGANYTYLEGAAETVMYQDRQDFVRSKLKIILNDITSGAFLDFRDVQDFTEDQLNMALSRYLAGHDLDARKYFEFLKSFQLDYKKIRDTGLYDLDPYKKPINEYVESLIEDSETFTFVSLAFHEDLKTLDNLVGENLSKVHKSENMFADGTKALRKSFFERYPFLQKYLVSDKKAGMEEVITQFDFNKFKKFNEGSGLYDVMESTARKYGVTLEEVFGSLDQYVAPSSFDDAIKGLDFVAYSRNGPSREAAAVMKRILPDVSIADALEMEVSQRSNLSRRLNLFLEDLNKAGTTYGGVTLTPMFHEISSQVYSALFEGSDDVVRWAERFTKKHPQMAQLLTQLGDIEEVLVDVDGGKLQKMGGERLVKFIERLHDYVPSLDTFDDANIKAVIAGFAKMAGVYNTHALEITGEVPFAFGEDALKDFTSAMRAANSASPETMAKLLDGLHMFVKDNPDNEEAKFLLDLFKNYPQYKPAFGAEEKAALNVMASNDSAMILKLSTFMESIVNLHAIQQNGMAMEFIAMLTDDKTSIGKLLKIVQQNMGEHPEFFEIFERTTKVMRAAQGVQNFSNFLAIVHALPSTKVFYNLDTKILSTMKMPAGVEVLPGGTLIIDPNGTAGHDFAIDLATVDFLHAHFEPFELNEVKSQYLMDVNSSFDYAHNKNLRTKGPTIEPITEATIKPTTMYYDLLNKRKARMEAKFDGFFPKNEDGSYDLSNVILTPEQATELAKLFSEISADPELKEFFEGLSYFQEVLEEVKKNAWELRKEFASELHNLTRSVTIAKQQTIAYETLKKDHAPFIRSGLYSFDSVKALQTVKTNIIEETKIIPRGVDYFQPSQITGEYSFSGRLSTPKGTYDSFYGDRFYFSKSTKMLEGKNGKGRPTYINRAEPLVNYKTIKRVYKGDSFNALDIRASSAEEFAVHYIAKNTAATRLEFLHPRLKQHLKYMGITERNIDKVIKSLEAYRKDYRKYPLNEEAEHYVVGVYHYLKEELKVNDPIDIGELLGDSRAKYAVAKQIATLESDLKEAQERVIDPKLPLDEKNKQSVQKSRDIAKAQKALKPLKEKYAYDIKIAPWLKRYEDIGDALKTEKDVFVVNALEAERSELRRKLGYGEGWDNRAQPGSFFQNYVYLEFESRKEAEFAIRRYYTGNPQVRRALFADLNSVRISQDKRLRRVAEHLMALYPQHKIYLGNNLAESFPMDEIEFDNARIVDENTIKYFLEISERDMHTLKNVTMVITNPMKHWNIDPKSGGYFAPEQKIMRQIHAILNKRKADKARAHFKIIGPDGRIFNHDGSMYPDFAYPQTNPSVYDRSRPSIKEKVRQNDSAYSSFNSVVKYAHRAAWSNDPMQDGDMLRHYVVPKNQTLEVKNNPVPHLMRASDVNSSERLNLSSGFTGAQDLFTKARLVPEYIDAEELELPMFEPSEDVTFEVEDSLFSRAMPAYWASLLKPIQDASLITALSELDQANDLDGLHAFHAAHLSSRFASVADDVKIKKMRGVLRQLFNETGVPNQFSSVDFLKTPVVALDSKLGEFWSAATPEGANNLGIIVTQLFRELNEQPHGLPVVFRNPYFKPDRDIIIDVATQTKYSYTQGVREVFLQYPLNEDEKQLSNIVNYADKEVDRLVFLINVTEKDMALFEPNIADNVILPKALNGYKKFAYPSRETFAEERLEDHIGRYGLVKNTSPDGVYYTMAPYRMVSRKISGLKLAQRQYEFGLIPSFDKYLQDKGMLNLSGELQIDTATYLLEEEAYLKQYPKVNPIKKVWEVLHKETGYTPEDIFLIKVRPNRKKFTEHTLIMISDYSKIYELRRGGFKVFTREQLDALNTAVDEGKDAHALFKAHIPNAKVMEAIEAGVTIEQVPEVNKLERARQVYWEASAKVRDFITGHLREKAKAHILIKGSTLIEGTDKTYFEALAEKLSEYSAKRLHGDYTSRDSTIDFKEITDINQIVDDVRKLLVESYGSPFDASEIQQIEDLEWLVNSLIVDGVNNNFVDNYAARMAEDAVGAMTPEMKEIMKLVSENEGETIKSELQSFVVDLAKQVNTLKIELTKYEAIRPRPFGEDTVLYYDSESSVNRARARVRAVLDDLLSLVNTKAALSKVGETIFSEMQLVAIREFKDAKEAFFGMYTAIEQNAFLDGPVHSEDASGLFEALNAGAFKEGDSKKVSLAKKIREFNAPHKVAERLEDRETAYQAKLVNTKLNDNALDRYDISTYSPIGKEGVQLKERDITVPKYTQVGDGIPDFTKDGKAQPFDIIKDMHEYAHDQKKGLTEFLKKYSFLQEHYDHLTQAGLDESAKLQYLLTQAAKFTDAALESDFDKVAQEYHMFSEPIPGFPIEFKWNEHADVTPLVKTTDTNAFNPKTLTVVSGGQTGADIGGLLSARRYGFVTGGKAPKKFWSEKDGTVTPKLLKELGLEEDASGLRGGDALIERSKANVDSADGTIAFLPQGRSVGTSKTIGYAQTGVWRHRIENYDGEPHKPNLVIKWTDSVESATAAIVNFLKENNIKKLNIAGSRESVVKAIDASASMQKRTEEIMDNVFAQLHAEFGIEKPQEVVKPIENSNVLNVNKVGPSVFDTPGAHYIGRKNDKLGKPASKLNNPFVIGKDGTREEVITKYETWLKEQLSDPNSSASVEFKMLKERYDSGQPLQLVCYCAPLPCHGDVLMGILKQGTKALQPISIDDVVAIMKKAPKVNKTKKGAKQKEFEQLSFADIMEEEKE